MRKPRSKVRKEKPELTLPDWYPLPIYSRKLSDDEWVGEVWLRLGFKIAYQNHVAGVASRLKFEGSDPKNTFLSIIKHDGRPPPSFIEDDELEYGDSWPVRGMTLFEGEVIAHLNRPDLTADEKRWAKRVTQDPKKWLGQFARSGIYRQMGKGANKRHSANYPVDDDTRSNLHWDVIGPRLPIMVNVNLDDETLKLAFSVWLAGVRGQSGEQKTGFTDKHLEDWQKFGVLQAFDLMMWSKVAKVPYTDAFIAQAIWPDNKADAGDYVDRTDRYRKVTKPKVSRLFTVWEAQRLENQVRLLKYLKRVAPRPGKDPAGGTENK